MFEDTAKGFGNCDTFYQGLLVLLHLLLGLVLDLAERITVLRCKLDYWPLDYWLGLLGRRRTWERELVELFGLENQLFVFLRNLFISHLSRPTHKHFDIFIRTFQQALKAEHRLLEQRRTQVRCV